MLRLKGKGVVYGELWFDEEAPTPAGVDILVFRQRRTPMAGVPNQPFLTIINDLTVPEDAIPGAFVSSCRYEVRRAETKDGLTAEFIDEPAARLDEFCDYFDDFAQQKSIPTVSRPWLRAAAEAGQLVLTAASCQGTVLVWHAYFRYGAISWLEHSASHFRGGKGDQRNLVGRANRWLHWRDMLAFRARGVTRYDWGGMFQDESTSERAGINGFKRSFGGDIEPRYEYTVPVTTFGRVYLPLREAWCRWAGPAPTAAAPGAA